MVILRDWELGHGRNNLNVLERRENLIDNQPSNQESELNTVISDGNRFSTVIIAV